MTQLISEPVVRPQPDAASYALSELALFPEFTRASYRATFGIDAPPFNPARPVKTWFDSTADTSQYDNVAVYRVLGSDAAGQPALRQLVIPAAEAAAVNLPENGAGSGLAARQMPLRALLSNERLQAEPQGVMVVRTGLGRDNDGGFTAADRNKLEEIYQMVSRILAASAGQAGTRPLLPETVAPPPAPAKPKLPYANSADAYWAAQPPEVQELRKIEDRGERERRAWQLAAKGFTIDRDIMVNLWDPYARMKSRMEAGYTWVPALGQPEIEVSPGFTLPGLKSYDPKNPPPGSIRVTTAFAEGYEN
jgi:hypothetical protein